MIADRWRGGGLLEEVRRAVSRHRRLLAAGLAAAGVAAGLAALEPDPPATEPVLTAARDLPAGTRLRASDLRTMPYPAEVRPAGAYESAAGLTGQVLAAPVRRGEPVTDLRVLGPSLLQTYAGPEPRAERSGAGRASEPRGSGGSEAVVAAPVRVADAGVLAYVRIGSRVDVLAAGAAEGAVPVPLPGMGAYDAGSAEVAPRSTGGEPGHGGVEAVTVVRAAPVIALPGAGEERPGPGIAGLTGGGSGDDGLVVLAVPPDIARDLARAAVTSRLSLVLRG